MRKSSYLVFLSFLYDSLWFRFESPFVERPISSIIRRFLKGGMLNCTFISYYGQDHNCQTLVITIACVRRGTGWTRGRAPYCAGYYNWKGGYNWGILSPTTGLFKAGKPKWIKAYTVEPLYNSHLNLRSEETRWLDLLPVRTKKRGRCREVAEARL